MSDLAEAWTKEARRLSATSLGERALLWTQPDVSRLWVPDELLPLHGCAAFAALSPAQRLTYNQAYACQLLEEFIWIESRLVVRPLTRLRPAGDLSSDAK